MVHPIDAKIVLSALLAISVYAILDFLFFRFMKAGSVLKWIVNLYFLGAILDIALCLVFLGWNSPSAYVPGFLDKIFCLFLSLIMYSLFCFLYILFIMGPYQSSVRLRILRELYRKYPRNCSYEDLLRSYSAKEILNIRLERLVSSGDLSLEGGVYKLKRQCNFFLVMDTMATRLRMLTKN